MEKNIIVFVEEGDTYRGIIIYKMKLLEIKRCQNTISTPICTYKSMKEYEVRRLFLIFITDLCNNIRIKTNTNDYKIKITVHTRK